MAVPVNLDKGLDEAYEDLTLAELLEAPVEALEGVTSSDALHLREAFNVRTVGDLGRNKFVRLAVALVDLAGFENVSAARHDALNAFVGSFHSGDRDWAGTDTHILRSQASDPRRT